jgi:hypothetical protein
MTRSVRDFSNTSTSTEVPQTVPTVEPVHPVIAGGIYILAGVLILAAIFAVVGSMRDPKNRRSYTPTAAEQKEFDEWPAL